MKKTLVALFWIVGIFEMLDAQIRFERAYFIDNEGKRTECVVKNSDWSNNPNSFGYQSPGSNKTTTASISEVQEFGVYNFSKYIRAKVEMDRSSGNVSKMGYAGNPEFRPEEVFLKVLIEGQATLYSFTDGDLILFFFKTGNGPITQLLFKKYIVDQNTVATNAEFREQLATYVKCPEDRSNALKELDYYKSELIRYFSDYHQCMGLKFLNYEPKVKRDLFNVRITSGLGFSAFAFKGVDGFPQKISPRIGLDAEFVLPFNKNKWAFFVEPNLQAFFSTDAIRGDLSSINYRSLELPVGLRHYFYVTPDLRFSLSSAYAFDFNFKSALSRSDGTKYDLLGGNVFAFGAGMGYKKFNAEMRWYQDRDLLGLYTALESKFSKVALVLGWKIF